MKPHIQRVFGQENLGIFWVCKGGRSVTLSGVGETPKDAYWSWCERDFMVSLNEEIVGIFKKRNRFRWPKLF